MKPTRHELLDMLAAMTDDELASTISEARNHTAGYTAPTDDDQTRAAAILGFQRTETQQ